MDDLHALRPPCWEDYIGQPRLKGRLDVMIEAARADERPLDHILLTAPPGSGKTSLAELIADRMDDDFMPIVLSKQNLKQFYGAIEEFAFGVVLLDELHNAPSSIQEMLQIALLEKKITTPWNWTIDVSLITFIGVTTSEHRNKLLAPLVQRFPIAFTWEAYTDSEMSTIITKMASRLHVDMPSEVAEGLGRAAGGTPRYVERLVKRARDLQAIGREITVEGVLSLVGLDEDGLSDEHLEYLRVLRDLGRVAGLNTLSSIMQMDHRTLEDLERLLALRGYIRRTKRGREITPAGDIKLGRPVRHNRRTAVA